MAAFTLKLGDLDLSDYVRVAQGDGLDPAASEYLTPEFQQSGLGEGNALNAVVANNREMAWPLHLFSRETAYTNLVTNPSVENNLTDGQGWYDHNTSGATVITAPERSTAWSKYGEASVYTHVENPDTTARTLGIDTGTGASQRIAVEGGATYVLACDVNMLQLPAGGELRMGVVEFDSGGTQLAAGTTDFGETLGERRISTTVTLNASTATVYIRVVATANAAGEAFEGYFDGLMLVKGSTDPGYFDGDTGGCQWDGTPHASTSSTRVGRSGLLDLLAGINRRLDGAADGGKLELEWRNEGADSSTFYDVVFGRFDHEYNHRRLAQRWMSGILRCWVKPYGHTGTTRILGTSLSPSIPVTLFTPTGIEGDADAAVRWGFNIVNHEWLGTRVPRVFAMSVLPYASYPYRGPAASSQHWSSASRIGASGAAGSQYVGAPVAVGTYEGNTAFQYSPLLSHFGTSVLEHRVLAMVRSKMRHGLGIRAKNQLTGEWLGPTAVATLGEWHLIDLGVLRIPEGAVRLRADSGIDTNVSVLITGGGLASGALGTTQPAPSFLATFPLQINEVYALPEDDTAFCVVPTHSTGFSDERYVFDGHADTKYRASSSLNHNDMSQWMRGQIPKVSPSAPAVLFLHHLSNSFANTRTLNAEFAVRERFTFER